MRGVDFNDDVGMVLNHTSAYAGRHSTDILTDRASDIILQHHFSLSPLFIYLAFQVSDIIFTQCTKKGTQKNFRAFKIFNICQQTFQNNFKRCISACQSFKFDTYEMTRTNV